MCGVARWTLAAVRLTTLEGGSGLPRAGRNRGLCRPLQVLPRGILLRAVPIGQRGFTEGGGELGRLVQEGDEGSSGAIDRDRLEQPNLAVRLDHSFDRT